LSDRLRQGGDAGVWRFGETPPRVEDARFITGKGRFTGDLDLEHMVHAAILRSPYAHGLIRNLDVEAARNAPGVLLVATAEDVAAIGAMPCLIARERRPGWPLIVPERRLLARQKVVHVGDPVVLVVADCAAAAADALELVELEIESLPAVTSGPRALAPEAPAIWKEAPDNICFTFELGDRGRVDRGLAAAAHVTSLDYRINRVAAQPMETRGAVATFDEAEGRFQLWCGHQKPHLLRRQLAGMFGVSQHAIRVVVPDVGGGFGLKGANFPEYGLVMWAARELGRPVRWQASRAESLVADDHARDNAVEAKLALDGEGRILALQIETIANLGAYLSDYGPHSSTNNLGGLSGMYRIAAIHASVTGVFTNMAPIAPYRGAGRPEATFAIERLIDQAAAETGIDPVELRRRNLISEAEMPYSTGFVFTYDSGAFERGMEKAIQLADWAGFEERRWASAAKGLVRGIGLANAIEQAGAIFEETAELHFDSDGGLTFASGTISNGQGHATAFRQLVGEVLGIDAHRVRLVQGDPDRVFHGYGTFGSRSLAVGGAALAAAAGKILNKARTLAAHLLEAAEPDLHFSDGRFSVVGTDRSLGLVEIAVASYERHRLPPGMEPGLSDRAVFVPNAPTFPNGTHVCEVEIDPETGTLTVPRYTVVDDVGRTINHQLLEGQIQGGVFQGLGQALTEEIVYDPETGQLLSGSFQDYAMPRADLLPFFAIAENNVPSTTNPLGLKGAGEAGTIGALPAVANAVMNALRPLGVGHLDMPFTSERVWRAIQDARGGRA